MRARRGIMVAGWPLVDTRDGHHTSLVLRAGYYASWTPRAGYHTFLVTRAVENSLVTTTIHFDTRDGQHTSLVLRAGYYASWTPRAVYHPFLVTRTGENAYLTITIHFWHKGWPPYIFGPEGRLLCILDPKGRLSYTSGYKGRWKCTSDHYHTLLTQAWQGTATIGLHLWSCRSATIHLGPQWQATIHFLSEGRQHTHLTTRSATIHFRHTWWSP